MNKLIPLMALALVILVGCAKEETTLTVADDQQVGKSSVWVMNTDGDNPVWELVTQDELPSSASTSATNRSNSAHTHGDFVAFGGFISAEWSGTENNGGPHGSAEVYFGDTQILLETACVTVDGDEAVYTGIITETFNAPPPPPPGQGPPGGPYAIGNYMNFKVIDNGQGANAPADQHNTLISSSPSQNCYTPDYFIWNFGSTLDVEDPGSVKVN